MASVARLVDSSFGGRSEDLILAPLFREYGRFCASHSSEVIVSTILFGVGVGSLAARNYGTPRRTVEGVCDAGACDELTNAEVVSADIVISTVLRCIAVLYLYLQFSNFNRLGSKYLLGLAGSFAIGFSFLLAASAAQFFDVTLTRVTDAMPIFLLLVDLSRAIRLAKFAVKGQNQEDMCCKIGDGLAAIGPALALDTLVEVMIIGVGTYAHQPLQSVCFFGCVSLTASFVLFTTFFPAALALTMEMSRGSRQRLPESCPRFSLEHLTTSFLAEEEDRKSNPVTQSIKVVMSCGLGFVHVFNWIVRPMHHDLAGMAALFDTPAIVLQPATDRLPVLSTDNHSLPQLLGLTLDEWLPLCFGILLLTKYVLFDSVRHSGLVSSRKARRSISSTLLFDLWPSRSAADIADASSAEGDESESRQLSAANAGDKADGAHASKVVDIPATLPTAIVGDSNTSPVSALAAEEVPPRFTLGSASSSCSEESEDVFPEAIQVPQEPRSLEECMRIKAENGLEALLDEEVVMLVKQRKVPAYRLEAELADYERAVQVRRMLVSAELDSSDSLHLLPFSGYDYKQVQGACCENVIGYMPVPVGFAGPLLLDGNVFHVPMATTEGCLVASTNRGCRALQKSNGVRSSVTGDSMTRAPALRMPSAQRAGALKVWLEEPENFKLIKAEFDSTSSYGRLQRIHCILAGCTLFVRFAARTGDAMGMNMVSKGVEKSVRYLCSKFSDLEVLSLSGNVCTDKKPSAINWVMGRGKSVVSEATLPAAIVKEVLKTNANSLVELNRQKNLVGSAMAGSIGGFNAHAANIVAAVFIATGQDAAQSGTSSSCLTQMELAGPKQDDLYITCTMPSLETGTVGGGTILSPQAACLKMLGVQGANKSNPGENAATLARVICATVLAGELSLMAALASGDLVKSHMRHNRSSVSLSIPPVISEVTTTDSAADKSSVPGTCTANAS